jgi:hypothetical protein
MGLKKRKKEQKKEGMRESSEAEESSTGALHNTPTPTTRCIR